MQSVEVQAANTAHDWCFCSKSIIMPTARPSEAPIAIPGINIPAGIRNPNVNI